MLVKKPPCDRFAPVVGKVLEGFGVPKPSSSLQVSPGIRDPGVRDVEHHHKIEREMDGRSFKYCEATRDSVFEQHHIRGSEIGNRLRSAPNMKRNDHYVCLGAKRRLDGLSRGLLCKGQTNEKHACGNCATGLNEHIGETLQPRRSNVALQISAYRAELRIRLCAGNHSSKTAECRANPRQLPDCRLYRPISARAQPVLRLFASATSL